MDLSVIIPIYNARATIERTIGSLGVIRDRGRVQVVAVDDGSTDGSGDVARRLLDASGFGQAMVVRQANAGSAAARNRAMRVATGRWVYFLDADDELASDPLPLIDAAPPDTTAILAGAVVVRDGRELMRYQPFTIEPEDVHRVFSAANALPIWATLLRRDRLTNGFDESLRYLEDWPFWLDNAGVFGRAWVRRDAVLTRAHAHGGNKSSQYAELGRCRQLIAQHWLGQRGGAMDRVERNNWRLQDAIGRMLQGQRPSWRAACAVPCSPTLYAKFLAHALAGRWVLARDPYAPASATARTSRPVSPARRL